MSEREKEERKTGEKKNELKWNQICDRKTKKKNQKTNSRTCKRLTTEWCLVLFVPLVIFTFRSYSITLAISSFVNACMVLWLCVCVLCTNTRTFIHLFSRDWIQIDFYFSDLHIQWPVDYASCVCFCVYNLFISRDPILVQNSIISTLLLFALWPFHFVHLFHLSVRPSLSLSLSRSFPFSAHYVRAHTLSTVPAQSTRPLSLAFCARVYLLFIFFISDFSFILYYLFVHGYVARHNVCYSIVRPCVCVCTNYTWHVANVTHIYFLLLNYRTNVLDSVTDVFMEH